MTTPNQPPSAPKRTPEEQEIIDLTAKSQGLEWAEAHAELILDQARSIGELPEREEPAKKPMRVYACPNSEDLVITNRNPQAKHRYERIGPDDPQYAELLPLVQEGYVSPAGYADNIFFMTTDDTSPEGLKKMAAEAMQRIRDYREKHGIRPKPTEPPNEPA